MADIQDARVAILAIAVYERSEPREPLERLCGRGAEVHVLSIRDGEIRGWDKDDFKVDALVRDLSATDHDALVLPGGRINPDPLRVDEENAGGKWENREAVVDRAIITSRGPDDLPTFIDKIVEEVRDGRHERSLSPAD